MHFLRGSIWRCTSANWRDMLMGRSLLSRTHPLFPSLEVCPEGLDQQYKRIKIDNYRLLRRNTAPRRTLDTLRASLEFSLILPFLPFCSITISQSNNPYQGTGSTVQLRNPPTTTQEVGWPVSYSPRLSIPQLAVLACSSLKFQMQLSRSSSRVRNL